MRKQKKKSIKDNLCLYRGDDGMKCGIGCLIPDDLYKSSFEGQPVKGFPEEILTRLGVVPNGVELAFLTHLQRCHDRSSNTDNFMAEFEKHMKNLAEVWEI
jgi:hypothetical protein